MHRKTISCIALIPILLLTGCSGRSVGYLITRAYQRLMTPPNNATAFVVGLTSTPATLTTETEMPEYMKHRKEEVDMLKTKVADPNASPNLLALNKKRLEVAEYEATLVAHPFDPKTTVVVATPDPVKGHFEEADGIVIVAVPYSPENVRIKNAWKGTNGKDKYLVYAGAYTKHPDEGIVIVRVIGEPIDSGIFYPTPKKSGSVKITDYQGIILQLTADNGDIFSFDVINVLFIGYPTPTPAPELPTPQATTNPYP